MEDDDELGRESLHVTECRLYFRFKNAAHGSIACGPRPVEINAGAAGASASGRAIGVEILEQSHGGVLSVACVGEFYSNLSQRAETFGFIAVDSRNEIDPSGAVPERARRDRATLTRGSDGSDGQGSIDTGCRASDKGAAEKADGKK